MKNILAMSEDYFFTVGLMGIINKKRQEAKLSALDFTFIRPEECDFLKMSNKINVVFHILSKKFHMQGFYGRLLKINGDLSSSTQIIVCDNFYETFKNFENHFTNLKVLDVNEALEKITTDYLFSETCSIRSNAGTCNASLILTDIQKEIMIFLARGYSIKRVADILNVKNKTIYSHRRNACLKLNIRSKEEYMKLITLFQDAYVPK